MFDIKNNKKRFAKFLIEKFIACFNDRTEINIEQTMDERNLMFKTHTHFKHIWSVCQNRAFIC